MLCNLHGRAGPSPAGGWPLSAPPGTCNSPAFLDGLWRCLVCYCCSLATPYLGHKERSMVSSEAKVWLPVCARQDQRNNCESGMRCTRWAPLRGRRRCSMGPLKSFKHSRGKGCCRREAPRGSCNCSSVTDPKDAMVPRPVSLVPLCPFSAPGGAHLPRDSGSVVKMAEVLEKQRRCWPKFAVGPASGFGIRRAFLVKSGYVSQINSFVTESSWRWPSYGEGKELYETCPRSTHAGLSPPQPGML